MVNVEDRGGGNYERRSREVIRKADRRLLSHYFFDYLQVSWLLKRQLQVYVSSISMVITAYKIS